MPVYMLRAGESGPVKIGYADDVPSRVAALQTAHYERLTVIRILQGGIPEERELHARFADQHIRGEWFHFSRRMIGPEIEFPDMPVPTVEAEPEFPDSVALIGNFHAALIRSLGGRAKLARALGLAPNLLGKWHERGIPSRYWHQVTHLARAEGIEITEAQLAQTKPSTAEAA